MSSAATVIVMGVCGAGKTTVGRGLADRLGWAYADADDFHARAAVAKMRSGRPLTDGDRAPWLARLRGHVSDTMDAGRSLVLACSALKARYRDALRADDPRVRFVHLTGERELLLARMAARPDHYMPASLLDSQLAALEPPLAEDALTVDVAASPGALVAAITAWLRRPPGA